MFTQSEQEILRPPRILEPSEWAEANRVLTRAQSAHPGKLRLEMAPYTRAMMDLPNKPGVIEINVMKAVQMAVSEAFRSFIGWCAEHSPDPAGWALPDEKSGRRIFKRKLLPLFADTPCLKRLMTSTKADATCSEVNLQNSFNLRLMWSGSAQSMASDPMRRGIVDEVDKMREWVGKESDPVELIRMRLNSYGNRRFQANISTPTTRLGKISKLFESSDVQLYYFVPCPHCGVFQRLEWAGLRWTRPNGDTPQDRAVDLKRNGSVWYVCQDCGEQIHQGEKPAMVNRGRWGTLDGKIQDAEALTSWPDGTKIGMQISALYCLWVDWVELAAEFIQAKGDLARTFNFHTQRLGLPFEQRISKTAHTVFAQKCQRAILPEGVVPAWAPLLVATVDTQADHFWAVLRAWGRLASGAIGSQRVWHNRVDTFDQLASIFLGQAWPVEGDGNPSQMVDLLLIDSGGTLSEWTETTRTVQVYQWVKKFDPSRVRATKGSKPKDGKFVWRGNAYMTEEHRQRRESFMDLWRFDRHHYHTALDWTIKQGTPGKEFDPQSDEAPDEIWKLNTRGDDEYNQHMSRKELVVVGEGSQMRHEWKSTHERHDYHDCEVLQMVACDMRYVHAMPPHDEIVGHRLAIAKQWANRRKVQRDVPEHNPWAVTPLKVEL